MAPESPLRRRSGRRWVGAGLLLLAAAWAQPAAALWGDSEEALGVVASLRSLDALSRNYDAPLLFGPDNDADGTSQTLLRVEIAGRPLPTLAYEIHAVQGLEFSTSPSSGMLGGGALFAGAPRRSRYRALDLSEDWLGDDADLGAPAWIDRAALKLALPWADLTLGRQALSFGKAYFWNPLDVFLAFDPRQFDRAYKAGVDAARVDLPLGDFSGLTLLGVLGRRLDPLGAWSEGEGGRAAASWYGSALLARLFGNLAGWDLGLQGGKLYGGWQVGAAASGERWGLELRAEAAWFWAEDSGPLPLLPAEPELRDALSAVLGLGRRFEGDLVVELEYLYQGAGDPDDLMAAALRQAGGATYHWSRNVLGLMGSYPLHPLWQSSLALLLSLDDGSALLQPGLVFSVADEAELLLGALLPWGERPAGLTLRSEFGSYPAMGYLQFTQYF